MNQAEQFLSLLDPDATSWSFRVIHPTGAAPANIAGSLHDKSPILVKKNEEGYGVFVVINAGGGKACNITKIRALFVDFDVADDNHLERLKAVPFPPSIIVESSPGKHHAYWLVDDCPVDHFPSAQKKLIVYLKSDKSIHDLPRVMRLPGFMHTKGERFESRMIHDSGDRYQWAEISAWLDSIQKSIALPVTDSYLDRLCGDVAIAIEGERNNTLHQKAVAAFAGAKEGRSLSSPEVIEQRLTEAALRAGVDQLEIARTIDSAKNGYVVAKAAPVVMIGKKVDHGLPPFADALINLPGRLSIIQDYIFERMIYPSRAAAGMAALSVAGSVAMVWHGVKTPHGVLGLNEYSIILAPTTFGKESLRAAVLALFDQIEVNLSISAKLPELSYATPASPQGLHDLLEQKSCQYLIGDEFAEWLCQSKNDGHKQGTVGYLMEAYTKSYSSICVPHAKSSSYSPVKNPRVSIMATSTGARMLDALTASQADSGTYNRFLLFVGEQDRIEKRYDMRDDIDGFLCNAANVLAPLAAASETIITFSDEAKGFYISHDRDVIENLKFNDGRLAGRLTEQACKIAALITLCDDRKVVALSDIVAAYAIRESLYYRASEYINRDGGIGESVTGAALTQLRSVFNKHPELKRSDIQKYSRKYKALSVAERNMVVRSAIDDGWLASHPTSTGRLVLIQE